MTNLEQIKHNLDCLADYQAEREVLLLRKQEAIDNLLTPELKAQMAAIEEAFAERVATVDEAIVHSEANVKEMVLQYGMSVKGNFLHAVWSKARITWDTRGLEGYIVAHPEVGAFRSVGKPSVSLRRV